MDSKANAWEYGSFLTAGMFLAAWVAPGPLGKDFTEGVLISIVIEMMILIGALAMAGGMAGMGMGDKPAGALFIMCGAVYLLAITYGMYQEFGSFMVPVMAVWLTVRSLGSFIRAGEGGGWHTALLEVAYEFFALMVCFMIFYKFPWIPRLGFSAQLPFSMSLGSVAPQNLAAMGVAYFTIMELAPPPKFVAWMRAAK